MCGCAWLCVAVWGWALLFEETGIPSSRKITHQNLGVLSVLLVLSRIGEADQ